MTHIKSKVVISRRTEQSSLETMRCLKYWTFEVLLLESCISIFSYILQKHIIFFYLITCNLQVTEVTKVSYIADCMLYLSQSQINFIQDSCYSLTKLSYNICITINHN